MTRDVSPSMPPAVPDENAAELITSDGVRLQTLEACPRYPTGWAVVSHPHTPDGGTMHNKVVETATRTAADLGLATVRFNFRGAGESGGAYDQGIGEVQDLRAAVKRAGELSPDGHHVIAGFSFGSVVAIRAVAEGIWVDSLVLIGLPLGRWDIPCPPLPPFGLTVIIGDADEFCPVARAEAWIAEFNDARAQLRVVPGTGHFFHGKLAELSAEVRQALGFV